MTQAIFSDSHPKAIDADQRASGWLGDANEAHEAGDFAKADKCFDKADYWLHRFNRLTGRA